MWGRQILNLPILQYKPRKLIYHYRRTQYKQTTCWDPPKLNQHRVELCQGRRLSKYRSKVHFLVRPEVLRAEVSTQCSHCPPSQWDRIAHRMATQLSFSSQRGTLSCLLGANSQHTQWGWLLAPTLTIANSEIEQPQSTCFVIWGSLMRAGSGNSGGYIYAWVAENILSTTGDCYTWGSRTGIAFEMDLHCHWFNSCLAQ